jgi:oligopeptide/dipeptide ABC transporter ATP-binding protein
MAALLGGGRVLQVRGLRTTFHLPGSTIRAVDGVDFDLGTGEVLGVVGESGCGKSVTCQSIMRILPVPPGRIEAGSVLFEGEDLIRVSERRMQKIRGNRIAMIFQEPMTSLNPVFTVGFQISEVLRLHRGMSSTEAMKESARLLALVGTPEPEERVREYPFQLSGGLRQRATIAMAVACEPAVLIADEPTTALDVTIQAQILVLLRSLRATIETSILFITHDLAVIAGFADRVLVMYAGVVVESAPVSDLFRNALHPYTQGLLASIPVNKRNSDGTREPLRAIVGSLPDPANLPRGCRFAERCPRVMPRCREAEPALMSEGDTRVRCYLYGEEIRGSEPEL